MSTYCSELPPHLRQEDADDHAELVQRAQGSTEGRGRDLLHVHGHKAGAEAGVEAHDEASDDEHLKGGGQFGEAHEHGSNEGEHVGRQHGVLPSETRLAQVSSLNFYLYRSSLSLARTCRTCRL